MTLGDRLLKYKKESRTTYRILAEEIEETFSTTYDLCNNRLVRMVPEDAIKIDTYLKQKGY